jgi:hypothetical protein
MLGFYWHVIIGINYVNEKCLAMVYFEMIVQFVVFFLGRLLRAT